MKTQLLNLSSFLFVLASLAASCNSTEEFPKEISYTEYALNETCQWTNLPYDEKVIIINSNEALKQYIFSTDSSYSAVDFSKHSLLLVSGKTDKDIYKMNIKNFQQLSDDRYQLDIEVLLYDSIVAENWCIALVIKKLKRESYIELNINKESIIYTCEFDNPLMDLPWLKEVIDGLEKDAAAGYKQHARIYQCHYKNGIGFLLELCVNCPDFGYWLKSCEGESLCVMWGEAGDPCAEFSVDFENKELIWEINNL